MQRGTFLAGARLTDGILASVAQIATGAWYDPIERRQAPAPEITAFAAPLFAAA